MELIYRGTTFNYDPAERAASRLAPRPFAAPYELICRGRTYRIDPNVAMEMAAEPVAYKLNYRGTAYEVHRNEQGTVTAIASSTNASKHRTFATVIKRIFSSLESYGTSISR
jgi:hypothetical protein